MSSRILFFDQQIMNVPVADATAIAKGDNLVLVSGAAIPMASYTWNTDLATTQAEVALIYLGVADSEKVALDGQLTIRVATRPVVLFDCASASFAVLARVGPAKQSGNLLENQKVVSVATASLQIGRVFEKTTSLTTVKVQCKSVLYGAQS